MTDREAFEAFARTERLNLEPYTDGYRWGSTHSAWKAWQASRAQALKDAYAAMFTAKGCKACRFDAQTAIRSLSSGKRGE